MFSTGGSVGDGEGETLIAPLPEEMEVLAATSTVR